MPEGEPDHVTRVDQSGIPGRHSRAAPDDGQGGNEKGDAKLADRGRRHQERQRVAPVKIAASGRGGRPRTHLACLVASVAPSRSSTRRCQRTTSGMPINFKIIAPSRRVFVAIRVRPRLLPAIWPPEPNSGACDRCGALAATVGTGKGPVSSTQSNGAQRVLGRVVVDLEATIGGVGEQGRLQLYRIAQRR